MSKCEQIRNNLDWLLDHPEEIADLSVQEHLESCPDCRRELAEWKQARELLVNSGIKAPDSLKSKLLQIPEKEELNEQKITTTQIIPWPRMAYSLAAMFLICLGIAGYFAVNNFFKPIPEVTVSEIYHDVGKETDFKVTFYLPEARSVFLVGDFNHWNRESLPMRRKKDGSWEISVKLDNGYYQYQLLVDGAEWHLDQNNPMVVSDDFGGMNSGIYL